MLFVYLASALKPLPFQPTLRSMHRRIFDWKWFFIHFVSIHNEQSENVQKKQPNSLTNKSKSIHSDNILIQQLHGSQTKVSTFNVNWIFLGPKAINLWQWINTYIECSILTHARETKTHSFSLSVARERIDWIYFRVVFDSKWKRKLGTPISIHGNEEEHITYCLRWYFHFAFNFCANGRKMKYVETKYI